jgi:hypothetical protein
MCLNVQEGLCVEVIGSSLQCKCENKGSFTCLNMCDKSIHSHVTAANNTANHNTQNDKAVHPLQATSAGPSLPKWACPLVLKCSKMLIQE